MNTEPRWIFYPDEIKTLTRANVPRDFFEAVADYKSGRVVDLDTALNDKPKDE